MMIVVVATALLVTVRLDVALRGVLDRRLPATISAFRVARAADALAASAIPLSYIASDEERQRVFLQVDDASRSLDSAIEELQGLTGTSEITRELVAELKGNILRLRTIVDRRIELVRSRSDTRRLLLGNLLSFEQSLAYRVRILQGDGAVITRLLSRTEPSTPAIIEIVDEMAPLLPVPRFYATVEAISARLLAAANDPTLTELDTSREVLLYSIDTGMSILDSLPDAVRQDVEEPFRVLRELVESDGGLLDLRREELLLEEETRILNGENREILERVRRGTDTMVHRGLDEVDRMRRSVDAMRRRSIMFLLVTAVSGAIAGIVLIRFYVDRNIIRRLSKLSDAMQEVAAGNLAAPLPAAGRDEIGRLASALRHFRTTAVETREREHALEESNRRVEHAKSALESKTRELEVANRKLTELSVTDGLTGLFNRRRLDETLELEWARAGHGGRPIALILLDIDYFKNYNDRYGHQAGDACLKSVADVLNEHSRRAGDFAVRYGGEEFCLICPYTTPEGVRTLAERIRESVEALNVSHEGSPFGKITASFGCVAGVPDRTCTARGLLEKADQALYAAKSEGRNRVHYGDSCDVAPVVP